MSEELRSMLKSAHEEELKDVDKYCEMAEHFDDNRRIKGILKDIAHEERTHALMIEHILDMEG